MATYGGVDLGATRVRAVVGDESGEILASRERPTPQGPTGDDVTEAVLECLRRACDDASVAPGALRGVGVGSIGPFDLVEGAVENPANLPDSVDRVALTGPISTLVDSDRVSLHNDTSAGVVGERFYGECTPDDVVYLTISTGIGAGVCVDGHVLSGWDGNAGEVGHVVVDPSGLMTCGCGVDGHWEAYCSGENITRYATRLHREEPADTAVPVDDPDFAAPDLFEHAGADAFADSVLDRLARWNTIGVATLVHAYAPRVVYVGGAVALNNPGLVLDPVRENLADAVVSNVPDVRVTTLGDEAVVRGALASAITADTGDRTAHP